MNKNAFLIASLTLLGVVAAAMVYPFINALLWALVLSVLMLPMHRKFIAKGKPGIAAGKATLIAFLAICLPLALVSTLAISQLAPALNDMQGTQGWEIASKIDNALQPTLEKIGKHDFHVKDWWAENGTEITQNLRAPATKAAKSFGTGIFTFVVALLSMFFFLRDGKSLREPFLTHNGLPREVGENLLHRVEQTVHAVFTGSVVVAVIQGAIMGITYALLGVPNSILLGAISVLLCVVPLLGAPVIYVPVGLLFLAQGETTKAAVVLAVGFLIVSQIDNVLKPFFIGSKVALHPLAIFVSVLGGIAVFGPIGLMVGPMVLSILLGLYDYVNGNRPVGEPSSGEA